MPRGFDRVVVPWMVSRPRGGRVGDRNSPAAHARSVRPRERLADAVLAGMLLLAGILAACGPGHVVIPAGGQELHVIVSGDVVRLEPTTVRSGEVYLVLDNPETNVSLVKRLTAPAETGPILSEGEGLTDDDLARLARGDTFHMQITSGFANGEPYGNVTRLVLTAGRYAFLADSPELLAARSGGVIPPDRLAVLLVAP
jgi:hypothetical protein